MNYTCYLSLDRGMSRKLVADYRKSVERIQAIAAKRKLPIEV